MTDGSQRDYERKFLSEDIIARLVLIPRHTLRNNASSSARKMKGVKRRGIFLASGGRKPRIRSHNPDADSAMRYSPSYSTQTTWAGKAVGIRPGRSGPSCPPG